MHHIDSRCTICEDLPWAFQAITVLSVNEQFSKNLPAVRSEMMRKLMLELPGALQANGALCGAVACGWAPEDPRQGPVPHDAVTCGLPP